MDQVRNWDCPRCDKHHRIHSYDVGKFVCSCGVDLPPHNKNEWKDGIRLGKYSVSFVSISYSYNTSTNKFNTTDHTIISWKETITKPMYDMIATADKAEEIYGKSWNKNPVAIAWAKSNPIYVNEDVEEVKSITLPGLRYKITLEDIEKLQLLS